MIVVDANLIIAFLDADDAHHDRAEALLVREIDDEFGINPLSLAEVLVAPARENREDEVRAALDELEVRELAFPAGVAVSLARIRARTALKMPDCCVLLTAETANARLATFDVRLGRVARARGIDVLD